MISQRALTRNTIPSTPCRRKQPYAVATSGCCILSDMASSPAATGAVFSVFPISRQIFFNSALCRGIVNLKPLVPGRSSTLLAFHLFNSENIILMECKLYFCRCSRHSQTCRAQSSRPDPTRSCRPDVSARHVFEASFLQTDQLISAVSTRAIGNQHRLSAESSNASSGPPVSPMLSK